MIHVIIQSRMGSTRLPGKVMKKILNKEIVLWCYDRCKKSNVDNVFVVTSVNKENDQLEDLLKSKNIPVFRGSENDLLDRFYQCCLNNNIIDDNEIIIRVTSDCPFIDPNIINDMIQFYKNNDYDYIINHNDYGITPEGSCTEVFNFKTLKYLWNNNKDTAFREHVTGCLNKTKQYNGIINCGQYVYLPEGVDKVKMKYVKISVDRLEDYEKSVQIAEHFNNYDFTYRDVLLYLQNEF
jgi:spore coat polysaccharide biosynthesis protein SpsF